ncbi:DUF5305 domain-containing protein [Halopenitus sp. POP-27]|uniref:DUF5305 domain-containing protein n=1 Tax=Halopenitus sp. POP-27 TaxID=2994425 RepID=UPI00246898DD|nr:DUF5305 domain-containing protein [Halopenitus sp. POP-27]
MSTTARIKRELAIYGGILGIALVLAGLLAVGGAGYAYTNPPVEDLPPEEYDVQEFGVTVTHAATVTGETPLYAEGETIENKPVYFTNSTPELDLTVETSVPDDRTVDLTHRLVLVHRGTFNDDVVWEREETVIAEEASISDGTHETTASVDVPDVVERVTAYESAMAGVGSVSTELRLETTYAAPAQGGETYEGSLSGTVPFEVGNDAYWLDGDLSATTTESRTRQRGTRQLSPDMSTVYGGLGIGVVLILVGTGLIVWNVRGQDVHELEMEIVRSKYDEWISTGEFPADSDKQYIYITTLEDLVDVAIDTNKRVIYDPDLETYSVVDDDLIYYHAADPTQIDSWVGLSGSQ